MKSNWLDWKWINRTQTKLTTLRYEDMNWLHVFNHYDIHLSGLCYYKNKICWFQIEEWDADEVFYYIYALPFKDKLSLLWSSSLFNLCIGPHWSYKEKHKGKPFKIKYPRWFWLIVFNMYYHRPLLGKI